ncbi:uncharacterized protein BX664DRAFT_312352 [Halteromyces radiatus]|uniref:uncharacterized protein n=1 Tax=Halteromyces radiatus TaxID=101107 RepID=UPI00221F2A89|nr:uncharacterized protein BX664DRAFT_312352 [Halteromyces radiatus]KAI8097517.1 hypothetical protein BX664DRAFT_312352 [Halteromyces radiatus]
MYATVTNPLLPSADEKSSLRRSFSTNMAQKWTDSKMRQMLISKKTKRIVPSPTKILNLESSKEKLSQQKPIPLSPKTSSLHTITEHQSSQKAPSVHYNGSLDTLDQFSDETLDWLYEPSSVEKHLSPWPTPQSIVLRKPYTKFQNYNLMNNPLAMVYLRVIDIVRSTSAKALTYYCTIQIHDQISTGELVSSTKYGKQSSQADIDEVYLLDLVRPTIITLRLYTKTKTNILSSGRKRSSEICIGQKEFQLMLHPIEKQVNRITFEHEEDTYQVTLIYGTFMNARAQALVANRALHADFLTVYLRGGSIPRWQRYWAVLHATHLSLYDFEYKETKAAQVVLPLHGLDNIFHPSNTDDDEQTVDVGRLGLALQFSKHQDDQKMPPTENRMYILPDDIDSVQEFRPRSYKMNKETAYSIPSKFLW